MTFFMPFLIDCAGCHCCDYALSGVLSVRNVSFTDVEMEIKTSLQVFGFTSFKDGQMKAIDRILHGSFPFLFTIGVKVDLVY